MSVTDEEALEYHHRGRAGKIEIKPTKSLETRLELQMRLR